MANELQGRRIAFVVANEGIEQVELTEPWQAVQDAGGSPELLAPQPGEAQAFNHLDKADTFPVDRSVGEADPASYDALVLPGGVANPDQLRTVPEAVDFVRAMFAAGKPAAVICHGPWQIAAIGLPPWTKDRTNSTASGTIRSLSGLATPPGSTSAS